jgi:hypothetical protein
LKNRTLTIYQGSRFVLTPLTQDKLRMTNIDVKYLGFLHPLCGWCIDTKSMMDWMWASKCSNWSKILVQIIFSLHPIRSSPGFNLAYFSDNMNQVMWVSYGLIFIKKWIMRFPSPWSQECFKK